MKPINVPTIPIDEAVARVSRFREKMIKSAAVAENNIPRAILIPIDDLLAIIQQYTTVDEDGYVKSTLQGVRTYFAIKAEDNETEQVTGLVVAVDLKGNDIIATSIVSGVGEEGGSEIYDFTRPCPDICDPESPLYIV